MKFYIAFSIQGTKKFTVAEYTTRKKQRKDETQYQFVQRCLGMEFMPMKSRRVSYDEKTDGIKLFWGGLSAASTGKPLRSPSWVARRFKELEAMGWKLVQDKGCR